MELYFLVNIEFLSQFDQDSVNGVKVVTVVATSRSKVQNHQIIFSSTYRLMILIPSAQKGLLADSSLSLDDQW